MPHAPSLLDPPRAEPVNPWPALLFCMTLPTVMSWVETRWVLPTPPSERPALVKYLFPAGKVIQFATPLVFVLLTEPRRLRLARPTRDGMLPALLFGLVVAAGIVVIYWGFLRGSDVMGTTPARIREWLEKFGITTPGGFLALAALIAIPHSLLEEYYWRWFVFGWLARRMSWPTAALLSSLAFMSHHVLVLGYYLPDHFWTVAVPFSLCVAFGGFTWAWLYQHYGSLYAPWLSHLVVDAAIMAVGMDMILG